MTFRSPAQDRHSNGARDIVYLMGFAPLREYLRFMATEAVEPQDPAALTEQWGAADAEHVRLAGDEPRQVDQSPFATAPPPEQRGLGALPQEMVDLVETVKADPIFRRAFSAVPTRIAMVELDPLVVYQRTIDLSHVKRLAEELGAAPPPDALFRFCLPIEHPTPAFRVRPIKDRGFVFVSESSDLRFLEAALLDSDHLADFPALGPIAGAVGLLVGFGSNFLNVIQIENRLILNNGNHRAYALRDRGITHAPCLVQQLSSREDLKLVSGGRLRRRPEHFLDVSDPPRLRHFFNPTLTSRVRILPRLKQVRVTFDIEEINI